MKMKGIMLITFLLLAALTIGAVSAEDNNTTSVDLQVADEGDDVIALTGYDEDEHLIYVNDDEDEGIDLDDVDCEVAYIDLPIGTTEGYFQILNSGEEVAKMPVDPDDFEHWDEDDLLYGTLYVGDINKNKIKDGDILSLMFLEYINGQYVEFEDMTVLCKVKITGSSMFLTELDSEPDAEISVDDIALNKTGENFIFVNVTEMGTFIITVETDDDDEYEVFKEDLATIDPYSESNEEYGVHYFCFAFSLDDLNNYTAKKYGGNSFVDLIDKGFISTGDEMNFEIYEDEDDEYSDFASESWTIAIKNGKIYFVDDEDDINVDCDELDIVMDEGWNETVILTYEVKRGIKGKIVIYLNDDQIPAFDKNINELNPVEYDPDDEFDYYDITIVDLGITQAGEFVLRYYFDDESGNHIYSYDEEDPETLVLTPSQIITGDNATIWVDPRPISVDDEDEIVIRINATDVQTDDELIIYVDGNETLIIIRFDECGTDEDGNYTITLDQLNLGVGKHILNITCKGTNSIANVTILTDLEIEIADETIYTTLNDAFVFISLEEDNILESSDITGLVNVTITDSEGNVIATIEKDIEDAMNMDQDYPALVILTNEMGVDLNGTYNVFVTYNGNKGLVQEEGNVTFKELSADDYGISINDVIDDDMIIIFDELPLDNDILVAIDGNEPITFNESSLYKGFDSQNNPIHYINQTQLGLTDGLHSISVSIDTGKGSILLANVNVIVDLKENVDPALTISVGNIQVGNAAIVLVTTNSTFTGNVFVQVANKNLTVNVKEGRGNVSVIGLNVGTYTATATFAPNAFFLSSVKTATFKVTAKPAAKKNTIKLTLKKVKVKRSAKKLVLKATLKINGKAAKGKKIIFKFKGKKYKAKTNKYGVAKVTVKKKVLKKLKKGKKVTYTAKYGKVTKKVTVKVKK